MLNHTPDSFHADGRHPDPDQPLARARSMLDEGAHLLDIGAESTRPGAEPVSMETEWARLAPVLDALRGLPVPLSVATPLPQVTSLRPPLRPGNNHGNSGLPPHG